VVKPKNPAKTFITIIGPELSTAFFKIDFGQQNTFKTQERLIINNNVKMAIFHIQFKF